VTDLPVGESQVLRAHSLSKQRASDTLFEPYSRTRIDQDPLNLVQPELRAGHGHPESIPETELGKSGFGSTQWIGAVTSGLFLKGEVLQVRLVNWCRSASILFPLFTPLSVWPT
jgi:hypothetical protein